MSQSGGNLSSASILQAAIACQPQGWARLCACYGPVVYRWARAASLTLADLDLAAKRFVRRTGPQRISR